MDVHLTLEKIYQKVRNWNFLQPTQYAMYATIFVKITPALRNIQVYLQMI